jgi:hypothetical protein
MNAPSADKSPWTLSADPIATTLEIVLPKQTVILSWNQFVYAEGCDDEVRITFASHDVIVRGAGLSSLLRAIPGHHVASIREVGRCERFSGPEIRFIREIEVRRVNAD